MLIVALVVATYFSYWGGVNITDAFQYQSSVVAAQRDIELLNVEQFSGGPPSPFELRRAEKLLATDLQRMDSIAQTEDELAPHVHFPLTLADHTRLNEILHDKQELGQKRFEDAVAKNTLTRDLGNGLFALVAMMFVLFEGRMRRRVQEGRSLVERLQRAFISKRRDLPNVDLGSVLISATRGSSVGGDTHDVFTYDHKHGMFMVADVSGKGIDAAVDTALVKYSIRTLFSENDDPGQVLAKFASIYARSAESLESFIVLFLGVIDLETGRVRYASAGHEPAWVRCGQDVVLLPTTGPIIGMEPSPEYGTKTLLLGKGDVIVVSTDGLTESRDAQGRQLGAEGVAAWLTELYGGAQARADSIVKRLRKRSTRITDDLALLVLRYTPRVSSSALIPVDGERAASAPQLVGGEAPS